MNVLAVDPGPHVGLAWINDEGDFFAVEYTPESAYEMLPNWIAWADVIVCEEFVIKGDRAREANVTIEMIGVVKYLCKLQDAKLVMQLPGEGIGFSTSATAGVVPFRFGAGGNHHSVWQIRGFEHPDYPELPAYFDLVPPDQPQTEGYAASQFEAWLVPR